MVALKNLAPSENLAPPQLKSTPPPPAPSPFFLPEGAFYVIIFQKVAFDAW